MELLTPIDERLNLIVTISLPLGYWHHMFVMIVFDTKKWTKKQLEIMYFTHTASDKMTKKCATKNDQYLQRFLCTCVDYLAGTIVVLRHVKFGTWIVAIELKN